jgi:hypothetical protein
MVWTKPRSSVGENAINDSVRGAANLLITSSTGTEAADAQYLTSFNFNGYSLGTNNWSGTTVVGWQWKGGGTAVTNTNGTISSQVSANPTAGFSIVTYTGTGANATVGHGLGVAPRMVIVKCRSQTRSWPIYHASIGNTGFVQLQTTTAALFTPNLWNNTTPTSSVFSLGSDPETNGAQNYVAYCFAPIAGYSAFGSYTGNGSADGTFIYTGFKPRYIVIKKTDSTSNWIIWDTTRSSFNEIKLQLFPNSSEVEDNTAACDSVSNGFKLRDTNGTWNGSGANYIYIAFAEYPFKNGNAAIYNIN